MKNKKNKKTPLEQETEYVEFLKKKLNSTNFKSNSTKEEIEEVKKKYDKAKLKLKFLKDPN